MPSQNPSAEVVLLLLGEPTLARRSTKARQASDGQAAQRTNPWLGNKYPNSIRSTQCAYFLCAEFAVNKRDAVDVELVGIVATCITLVEKAYIVTSVDI